MIHQGIQLAISALLVLFFLLAASRGLGDNASYWSDELWSVSASRADWGVMLRSTQVSSSKLLHACICVRLRASVVKTA